MKTDIPDAFKKIISTPPVDPFTWLEKMKRVYDDAPPEEKKAIDDLFDGYEKYKKEHPEEKQP